MATRVKNARLACLLLLLPILVLSLTAEARLLSDNDEFISDIGELVSDNDENTGEEEFRPLRANSSTNGDVPLTICGASCTATNVANRVAVKLRLSASLTAMTVLQKYYRCSVALSCKYDSNAYNKIMAGLSVGANTIICYPGPNDSTATSCPKVLEGIEEKGEEGGESTKEIE